MEQGLAALAAACILSAALLIGVAAAVMLAAGIYNTDPLAFAFGSVLTVLCRFTFNLVEL